MLEIINNKQDLEKAQNKFVKNIKKIAYEKVQTIIGYPGGNEEKTVYWSNKLKFWFCSEKTKYKYWNAFGNLNPKEHTMIPIICEINFPLKGIERMLGGAIAKDDLGRFYIVHRGKIGGGRRGIGKSTFINSYRGSWVNVKDGELFSKVARIAALDSTRFIYQILQFISEVERIKKLATLGTPIFKTPNDTHEFKKEFSGKRTYSVNKEIESAYDHGLIFDGLSSVLKKNRFMVGNDRNRDLYIYNQKKEITSVFEIKTFMDTTSIYTAIGQLLLNSVNMPRQPTLFLVIPDKPSKALAGKLNKLSLDYVVYKWKKNMVLFPGLKAKIQA